MPVAPELIVQILKNEIIRREIQEAPEAIEAKKQIEKSEKKALRAKEKATANKN